MQFAWKACPVILLIVLSSELIVSAVPAALAWCGRALINIISEETIKGSGDFQRVLPWLIISLGLALLNEVFNNISNYFSRRLKEELTLKIDIDSLDHSSKLDIAHFENPEFQDIALRASQNIAMHVTGFLNKVIQISSNCMKTIGLITILFIIDPLIVITVVPLLIPYFGFKWYQSKLRFNKEYTRATKRRWTQYFYNLLTNKEKILEVKLLNLAPSLIDKYNRLKVEFFREDHQIYKREFIGNFVFSSIFAILFYLLFARVSTRVMEGSLTIGDIAIFAGATRQLFTLLTAISAQASGIMEGLMYVENLIIFLKTKPTIQNETQAFMTECKGDIEFQNVSFKYPGSNKNTLNDISFKIKSKETIAIIGKNGSGKSTLVKLIARFYDPDEGCILLDKVDLKNLSLQKLQDSISFVFQTPNRYEGPVKENISYGNSMKKINLSEIKKFAKIAGAHQMIEEMPEKYSTNLGRQFGEYDLSGGQWQSIAIARAAACQDASILILDEPAAGLDAQSKAELILNFSKLSKNRTTIMISHRFSTLELADRIIVLDKGKIIALGTHKQLLVNNKFYALMYEQSKKK